MSYSYKKSNIMSVQSNSLYRLLMMFLPIYLSLQITKQVVVHERRVIPVHFFQAMRCVRGLNESFRRLLLNITVH